MLAAMADRMFDPYICIKFCVNFLATKLTGGVLYQIRILRVLII